MADEFEGLEINYMHVEEQPEDSPLLEPHNAHWDKHGISLMYRNGVTILLRTFGSVWFAVTITVSLKQEKVQRTADASDDDGWLTKQVTR